MDPVLKKSGTLVAQGKEDIKQYITGVNESVGDGDQQKVICFLYHTYVYNRLHTGFYWETMVVKHGSLRGSGSECMVLKSCKCHLVVTVTS